MTEKIKWQLKSFNELNIHELYAILRVRAEVFVAEQTCFYVDPDNKDIDALHLCGYINSELAAYARLLPPGISFEEASIGRVLTAPSYRRKGFGMELMKQAIEKIILSYRINTIRIGAQVYLEVFYNGLGFKTVSEIYDEDGIPHIEMLYCRE